MSITLDFGSQVVPAGGHLPTDGCREEVGGALLAEQLGRLMVAGNLINEGQFRQAMVIQKKEGKWLGDILLRFKFVNESSLQKFISEKYNIPAVNLSTMEIDPVIARLVPPDIARKHCVISVARSGSTLKLAIINPDNVLALDEVKFAMGSYKVEPLISTPSAILQAINRFYVVEDSGPPAKVASILEGRDYTSSGDDAPVQEEESAEPDIMSVEDLDTVVGDALGSIDVIEEQEDTRDIRSVEAPIVKLVNGFLTSAIQVGASDIHVEPYEAALRIRFRVDGVLKTSMNLPIKVRNAVVSRIKIISKLNIAERRLPQDGRIKLVLGKKRAVDFRVSVLPTLFGEKVVLRILDRGNLAADLTQLGFDVHSLQSFTQAIESPYGMVLVTGPTGSGKTTTLYAALNKINTTDINIMTAEDPVEYNLAGINQVQIREEIGLGFPAVLRSFLRQDPDVIMVGEIRDYETAEISVKAALTGHMVLSTLHTNDAPTTINRLLNMGIEPFLVASSVNLVLAQRLVRRICIGCKTPDAVSPEAILKAGFGQGEVAGLKVWKGKGCERCGQSGFKGRVALYEVMVVQGTLREMILQGASADELKKVAVALGMKTLRRSGLDKVAEGITTLSEVLESTMGDGMEIK